MKLAISLFTAAILAMPAAAVAQTNKPLTGPGQSEYAPGQRAKGPGDAKNFAPGQRMNKKDVKGQGASDFAPGHQPNAATTTTTKKR
jgi:hypothetical protein